MLFTDVATIRVQPSCDLAFVPNIDSVCNLLLGVQFARHEGPRKLLLSTAAQGAASAKMLQESSPADFFWAKGIDGTGSNHLGRLLMQVRDELQQSQAQSQPAVSAVLVQMANGL